MLRASRDAVTFDRGLVRLVAEPRAIGHCDGAVKQQTLPEALEYVWQGYPK